VVLRLGRPQSQRVDKVVVKAGYRVVERHRQHHLHARVQYSQLQYTQHKQLSLLSGVPQVPGQAPLYLADDCRLVSDSTRRSLQSADVSTCVVPRTLSSYGDRTFAAAGPRLWSSLPVQLRNPDITYGLFRRQLKGHLFREA